MALDDGTVAVIGASPSAVVAPGMGRVGAWHAVARMPCVTPLQEEEDRLHNYRPPGETSSESAESDRGGVVSGPSHRRRRLHALFDPGLGRKRGGPRIPCR